MGEIKIAGYVCERCSHKWISRNSHKPICCARCKSPYWNVPRKAHSIGHRNNKKEEAR